MTSRGVVATPVMDPASAPGCSEQAVDDTQGSGENPSDGAC